MVETILAGGLILFIAGSIWGISDGLRMRTRRTNARKTEEEFRREKYEKDRDISSRRIIGRYR